MDQIIFCVKGEGEALLEHQAGEFEKGDGIAIPAAVSHNVRNTGENRSRLLPSTRLSRILPAPGRLASRRLWHSDDVLAGWPTSPGPPALLQAAFRVPDFGYGTEDNFRHGRSRHRPGALGVLCHGGRKLPGCRAATICLPGSPPGRQAKRRSNLLLHHRSCRARAMPGGLIASARRGPKAQPPGPCRRLSRRTGAA